MRTYFRAFEDFKVVIFIKIPSKSAYLQQMTFRDNRANIHYDKTVILSHFPGNAWTTRCFFSFVFFVYFLLFHGQNVKNEAFCVK